MVWAHVSAGIDGARRAYERLQGLPHSTGPALAHTMLALEHAHLPSSSTWAQMPASRAQRDHVAAAHRRIAQLYERVLSQHGADAQDMWLDYVRFELARGEYERAG